MDETTQIFDDLVRLVIDGTATEEEYRRMAALMRDSSTLRARYCTQMRVHAMLKCRSGRVKTGAGSEGTEDRGWHGGSRQPAVGSGGTWKRTWWKVAAAAAAAVVAATVWQATTARRSEELGVSRLRSGYGGQESGGDASGPVALMQNEGGEGLELPGRLPGMVRLEAGQAVVRLGSGVELTLLGPLELEVRDAMSVRLAGGRLLAKVPPVASGFTVRTRELEVWDIGTVFGVSAEAGRSDVFVFGGSVQVSETSGEPVDLCEAGEGVYVVLGSRPVKVAADWPEARGVFAEVRGAAALADPAAAFEAAEKIVGMWVRRYAPEVARRSVSAKTFTRVKPDGAGAASLNMAASRQSKEDEMNGTTKAVTGAVLSMVTATALAESKWFSVDASGGSRLWSEAAGWLPTPALPNVSDTVSLNNSATTPANPLVIADGTDAVCWALAIADHATANYVSDGRIPSLHMSGGSLNTSSNTAQNAFSVGHHVNGYGLLTLSGGTLSNICLTVGESGIGVVTNDGATVRLQDSVWQGLYLGRLAQGRGTFVQKSGIFDGGITVGHYGTGTWVQVGGTVTPKSYVYVGRSASGAGLLDVRGPGLNVGAGQTLYIGYSGLGVLEQRATLSSDYFKIGGATDLTSIATVYEGATNLVGVACHVGGYLIPEGAGTAEKPGKGILRLKGGVLRFPSGSSTVNLYVGRFGEGHGRIEGWGTVAPSSDGATNVRMMLGSGVVEADGEGEMRTLDLNQVVSVTNHLPNGASGTNGWYAVNKGRVLYPRTWFDSSQSSVTRCLGDWSRHTEPGLVNSVCATFTGITQAPNYFRGGFYASDRDDIPGGLPVDGTTVGVWQLGLSKDLFAWTGSQAAPFATATLTFRYDQNQVKSHQKLALYRHTGSAWVKVGGRAVSADHCITTTASLAPLSDTGANIGWFALVTRAGGTLIRLQ